MGPTGPLFLRRSQHVHGRVPMMKPYGGGSSMCQFGLMPIHQSLSLKITILIFLEDG